MPSLLISLILALVPAVCGADKLAPAGSTLTALATFDKSSVPKDADTSQLLFFDKDEKIVLLDEVEPNAVNPWVRGKLVQRKITLANGKVIDMPTGKKRNKEGFFPLAYTDGSNWVEEKLAEKREEAELEGFRRKMAAGEVGGAGTGGGEGCGS